MAPPRNEANFMMILKSIYNNEFGWNTIKSIGLFALGATVAYHSAGMEIMPSGVVPH